MVLLEAAVVVVTLGLLVYGTVLLIVRPREDGPPDLAAGEWRVAHYEKDSATRIVVQKVARDSSAVLDEHVVATVPVDHPRYDETFLAAMAVARQRRALFEAEDAG